MSIKPTRAVAAAVNDLCARNERTRGAVVGEVFMGERFVLVTLRRPVVVNGEWEDVAGRPDEVDLFDLLDAFQHGRTGQA